MPNANDYNTYIGPALGSQDGISSPPGYPLWMYHPVLPAQIVNDPTSQAALISTDGRWQTTDPNATT